ncbi:hypothetical protein JCM10207_008313 [Rhodosporidiobolus poonsookiae]
MYQPPSGGRHGRSASIDSDNRRASTHSLGLSYAYGAPVSPKVSNTTPGRSQTSPGRTRSVVSGSTRDDIAEEEGEEAAPVDSGRAAEPASVRYGRIAQRKRDTGHAYPQAQGSASAAAHGNTSVNIANAFKAATSGLGGVVTGGRREDFGPLNGNGAAHEEEEDEEDEGVEIAEERPAKEASAPASAGKKRKKHVPKDPTFKHRPGETSSSEESEYDQTRGKQKKRAKTGSEGDDLADDPAAANKPRRRSTKPADPSYRPNKDPDFHAGQTSSSDDDGGASRTHRRRKSKGKGKASLGGGMASQAIPRGHYDGEVWYGKKRKGRKGGRRSTANGEGEENDDEESDEQEHDPEDLGGMDDQEHDGPSFDEEDTPQSHSFFLRPKSPSAQPPPASPQQQPRSGWRFPLSPFRFGSGSGANDAAPVDPAFGAFDRSLGDGDSLSVSLEDSAIRGSSYDFSEEERIVRTLELAHAARMNPSLNGNPAPASSSSSHPHQIQEAALQKEQERRQPTPGPSYSRQAALAATPFLQHLRQQKPPAAPSPSGSVTATPVPYTGAYPHTPAANGAGHAGPDSPVSAFRRRNGKGVPVPSMLGAGTKLGASVDENDRDLDQRAGELGRRIGGALKPVVGFGARLWAKTQDPLLDWMKIWRAVFVAAMALFVLLVVLAPSATQPPVPDSALPTHHASFRDYLPFFRSKPSTPYLPPDVPPDSLEGLIARLSHLESTVGRISSSSDSQRQQHAQDRQALTRLNAQLELLESALAAEQQRAKAAIETAEKSSAKEAAELGKAVQSVKGELDRLVSRVKSLSTDRSSDLSELHKLQSTVEHVERDIVALNSKVVRVAKDLEDATDFDRITKIALEAIGKKLPGKMAARIDDSGRLEIDPSFWRVLKDAFADKNTVDSKLVALESSKGSSKGGKAAPAPPLPAAPPSWHDFLASNEEQLKAWVASDLSSRTGSDAFLSKQQFLDLLRREIKTLKRDFETKAHDNFEQMGQELLNKVAKQEELRRKDAASAGGLASHLNPFHRSHHQADSSGSVTLKGADGQNVTAIISSLVDSALIRYSKDVLARPDYALYTSGGRVIRSLTSPTYEPHPISAARSALAWLTGTSAPRGRPPVTALHPDTAPGSCWPFAGQQGQIGVQLSRRVVPSDITLEHISREIALDGDVSSAPREFEVWGVVEAQEDVTRLAQYRQQQLDARREAGASGAEALNDSEGGAPASLPPSANHLLLASGAYDPSAPSPVQSFPVTAAARQLGIPVQVVVVKVLSNHGESAYTCLYRVRVSGTTEAQALAGSGDSA